MGWIWNSRPFSQFSEQLRVRSDLKSAVKTVAASIIPVLIHELGWLPVHVVITSMIAQNIAMLEVRGDYRLRVSLLMVQALLLCTSVILGTLAIGHLASAVLGAMVVAFGAALWRHFGSNDYGPPFAAAVASPSRVGQVIRTSKTRP